MKKKKPIDIGNIIGAVIFILLFLGLVWLGLYGDTGNTYESSFFDDIGSAMKVDN